MSAVCRVLNCQADAKANHLTLHAASDDLLAATPSTWPTYARNQAELARRSQ